MSIFSLEKGFVLEGKHLYGTDITPVESTIREGIAQVGFDLFPDRSHLKYLHRGFGKRGIGTYTLQFADDVICLGERFAVVAQHVVENDEDYVEFRVQLDGSDWDLDVFMKDSTTLTPYGFKVALPKHLERDVIMDSSANRQSFSDFAGEISMRVEELTNTIEQNIGYAEVN